MCQLMVWERCLVRRSREGVLTCALALTAVRARAARKSLMVLVVSWRANV